MDDTADPPSPIGPPSPRATTAQLKRDHARIASEIDGTDGGIDPFPAAVRATRMPMIITNPRLPDNPIAFANDSFCRLTGYGRDEIVGRNCRFLQGPETDPAAVARLREAVAAPRAIEIDLRNYRKDGTPFWNRLLMAPVNDARGKLAYFFASQLDVTLERERLAALEIENAALAAERRADRDRLAFSVESHQLAVEAAEIGTWDLDLFTDLLTWSDRTKAMFGISPNVPCSMADFYAGLHPEDRDATAVAFASALDPMRRTTYDVEYRTIGKEDGVVRWVAAKGRGMFDETGRCVRALGTAIDATDRRLADEALRGNEARLRFLDTLGKETAKSLDADAILATTTRMVAEHLALSNCAYADMDPDEDGFTIRGNWAAEGSPSIVGHYSLADFGTLAVRNLGAGEPLIVNDNLSELAPEEAATFQAIGIAATICMPLVKEGRLTALMAIHDRVPRVWTAYDLTLIREVTERCWAHIERVRADAALREAADALAALNATLEAEVAARAHDRSRTWQISPDLLGVLNGEGYFESSNPAWQVTLGLSAEELRTTPVFDFLHPDDLVRNHAAFDRVRQGIPVLRFENRYRHKDGRYRWLSWVAVPEGDKVYCSARDITLEKEQEAALAQRTAERDQLWTLSEDMLARANYEGMMSAVSPAWTRVLGWSEAELLSRPYATFMHPDDMEPTIAALGSMGDTTRPTRFENRIATRDGVWKWIEWTVAPEADGANFIAVGRDLSIVKAREAELASAQESLRQSQKMEAVGQLTGGLAHDFNNLLAGISGSLELMQTRMQQGRFNDVERYMVAAQGAAKRAAALTHRLLAFSRRQTLDPKPTNVNRLVADLQELIQRTVGPAILIEVVGASGIWPALVDRSQLENALLNLCINARDAMPDGGRITIETANRWLDERAARQHDMPKGQYLSLCVSDTGTGMPPEVIARVFEPFFTTKPLGQGTGLGLSMIYGFAQQSGGQVRIYSEVGKGTTVCIYLPRHYGAIEDDDGPADPAALPRSDQGETVLIVDDEPTVRMLVTDILADLGYTAIEAGDSATGLKLLQSDVRIDLLVTDVGLPGGMNGRQMADAGRAVRPDLKVLFITGYAENAVLGNGDLDPGMQVLTKPFPVEAMAARIRQMIQA